MSCAFRASAFPSRRCKCSKWLFLSLVVGRTLSNLCEAVRNFQFSNGWCVKIRTAFCQVNFGRFRDVRKFHQIWWHAEPKQLVVLVVNTNIKWSHHDLITHQANHDSSKTFKHEKLISICNILNPFKDGYCTVWTKFLWNFFSDSFSFSTAYWRNLSVTLPSSLLSKIVILREFGFSASNIADKLNLKGKYLAQKTYGRGSLSPKKQTRWPPKLIFHGHRNTSSAGWRRIQSQLHFSKVLQTIRQ